MISGADRHGRRSRRSRFAALAGAWLAATPLGSGAASAEPPILTLDQLMQRLHAITAATARFTERRYLKILATPLESSGTLSYVAPDRLREDTVSPQPAHLIVDRDRLTIDPGPDGRPRTLALGEHPEIGALVEGMRAVLAGDLPALDRFYKVTFQGTAAGWQILLQPKDRQMQELVTWIRIAGSGTALDSVWTQQADGGSAEMTIAEARR